MRIFWVWQDNHSQVIIYLFWCMCVCVCPLCQPWAEEWLHNHCSALHPSSLQALVITCSHMRTISQKFTLVITHTHILVPCSLQQSIICRDRPTHTHTSILLSPHAPTNHNSDTHTVTGIQYITTAMVSAVMCHSAMPRWPFYAKCMYVWAHMSMWGGIWPCHVAVLKVKLIRQWLIVSLLINLNLMIDESTLWYLTDGQLAITACSVSYTSIVSSDWWIAPVPFKEYTQAFIYKQYAEQLGIHVMILGWTTPSGQQGISN